MDHNEKQLLIRIDEVLHYLWDPIGISDTPEARDEYYDYAAHVFSLCKSKASKSDIANYLSYVVNERMGLSRGSEHDLKITDIILEWAEFCEEQVIKE